MTEWYSVPGQKENPVAHYSGTVVTLLPVNLAPKPYTLTDADIALINQYSAERKAATLKTQDQTAEVKRDQPSQEVTVVDFSTEQISK